MSDFLLKKQQAEEILKLHWGYEKFRDGQEKVVDNILEGKSTVVIMPTGGGKSLCYQLPSLVLDGVTIVISPLIALMKDQVDNLERVGIPATFINSAISSQETYNRIQAVKNGSYKLLYIAPERFYNQEFVSALQNIDVSLFAIDEAHCISQWGHDFRPSYTKLSEAIKLVGDPTVVALTATATPEVKDDIIKQAGLDNPKTVITGFSRPNLHFGVVQANEGMKPRHVLDAISSTPEQSGIVYVSTRKRADDLLQTLLENNIEAVAYHAGMDPMDRKWVQDNFINNKVQVIVATNAFGLGIDKSDIRFVIHYDMPGTVEAYYQEAGRAGRDGKESFCMLLYNSRDRYLQEFFIKGDNPPATIIFEIYDTLLSYESDTVLITYSELSDMLLDKVPDMAIGTSIKILEKAGVIQRSREKNASAYLKLLKSKEEVILAIGTRAKKSLEIFDKLINKYEKDLMAGWDINLEEVAEILDIKKDSLTRLIKKLREKEMVEYNPPFKGTEIRIMKRVDSKDLDIDIDHLKIKQRAAYKKLDQMENYVFSLDCRQKNILDYFGDAMSKNCGKCDLCLTQSGYERKTEIPVKTIEVSEDGSEGEYEVSDPENDSGLSTKLTQLQTFDLMKNGMSIEEIAKQRNLKRETVISHIIYLIEKKIIPVDIVDGFVDSKRQNKIIKRSKKIGTEKLKPIKEYLGDDYSYEEIKLTIAKVIAEKK